MKKVLLSTAAVFAMASGAYAAGHAELSVSVGGGADLGVRDISGVTEAVSTANIDFSGTGETDGGLGFGFDYTIITGAGAGGVGGIGKDNMEVFISGSWGKLTIGDPDSALQSVAGIGDIGFKGIGVDDVAEFGRGLGASGGVLYSNTVGAVSFYLSHGHNLDDDDVSVGVSFGAGDFTIGLGYDDTTAGGLIDGVTAVDLAGSFGSVSFDVYYEDHDLGNNYGTIIGFDTGAATIQLGLADGDQASDAAIGVGFAYDLGGGATLEGGVGEVNGESVWDLGIEMTF